MAHTKAGGSVKNLNTSNPKYLGVKLADGQKAAAGMIIVRQRGTKIMAGQNVQIGKDHTLLSLITGVVSFREMRKTNFDGTTHRRKIVDVLPVSA
jgi:large subunit ribosomal protein L27